MAKFTWTETFLSIEGEGSKTGTPTAYLRLSNCPFTCQGFNNPDNIELTNEVLGFDPADFKTIDELPPINIGCDTIYSWDKRFRHMWKKGDELDVANELVDLLPDNNWINPNTNQTIAFSITGGEPTLYQKQLPFLLHHYKMKDVSTLIIETNCSVKITDEFIHELQLWITNSLANQRRTVVWSNSPKLSNSGEPWKKAIVPSVATKQISLTGRARVSHASVEQYFKFVTDGSHESITEIMIAMNQYWDAGISRCTPVYLMPEACTVEQQNEIGLKVANVCIQRGFIYSHRLHLTLFGNTVGT